MKSTVRLVQSFCNVVRVKHLKCAKKNCGGVQKSLHCIVKAHLELNYPQLAVICTTAKQTFYLRATAAS